MTPFRALGDDDGRASGGWLAAVVPDSLAVRALSVEVRGPSRVTVGDPVEFAVVVQNRLPTPVSLTLPSSRLWGWEVDGLPEADERGYEAPDAQRIVTFGRREQRVFETRWDGRIRTRDDGSDRWVPSHGPVTFTGYLAVPSWEQRGVFDTQQIEVVPA